MIFQGKAVFYPLAKNLFCTSRMESQGKGDKSAFKYTIIIKC